MKNILLSCLAITIASNSFSQLNITHCNHSDSSVCVSQKRTINSYTSDSVAYLQKVTQTYSNDSLNKSTETARQKAKKWKIKDELNLIVKMMAIAMTNRLTDYIFLK